MSHYARVENGLVTQVIVAEQDYIDMLPDKELYIQTSYRTSGNTHPEGNPLRANYAGIGYTYDSEHDVFYAAQPTEKHILNTTTWLWELPIEGQ